MRRLSRLLGPLKVNSGDGIALGDAPLWRAPSAWCLLFATRPTNERSVAAWLPQDCCPAPGGIIRMSRSGALLSKALAVPIVGRNGPMPVEPPAPASAGPAAKTSIATVATTRAAATLLIVPPR